MKKKRKRTKYIVFLIIITIFVLINNISELTILKNLSASIFYVSNDTKYNIDNSGEINDLKTEIEDLKKELKLDNVLSDKKVIYASIIKRSPNYWYDIITINKGYKDGVEKGDAILDNNSLVGEVVIVNKRTSEVKLISNNSKNYISAKFNYNGKDYYGIIKKYSILKNEFYLENVIGDFKDIKGINVVTSGLSNNMPSGLLIGQIKEIKSDKYNLSYNIVLSPNTDFNDIRIVKVVGKK